MTILLLYYVKVAHPGVLSSGPKLDGNCLTEIFFINLNHNFKKSRSLFKRTKKISPLYIFKLMPFYTFLSKMLYCDNSQLLYVCNYAYINLCVLVPYDWFMAKPIIESQTSLRACLSVWSVCHNFLKGREVALPCSALVYSIWYSLYL